MTDAMINSSLVRLKGHQKENTVSNLWGLLELSLPGAMKDRVALNIINRAEIDGRLKEGGLIVESSSGTLAEGIARIGAIRNYRVIIVTDPRIDHLMKARLTALGAKLEIVEEYDPQGGWQLSRLNHLKKIIQDNPGAIWPCQYDNEENSQSYHDLAEDLYQTLGQDIGAIVGPVGSGGSLCGIAQVLKEKVLDVKIIGVDAVGSVLFHQPDKTRLQSGHGNSIVVANVKHQLIDQVHWLNDGEAFKATRELSLKEGIFAGASSGVSYLVASWVASMSESGKHTVAIFPDRGDRYYSTIYSDDFLIRNDLFDTPLSEEPDKVEYSKAEVKRWSYASLPHDSEFSYFDPKVVTSSQAIRKLGLCRELDENR